MMKATTKVRPLKVGSKLSCPNYQAQIDWYDLVTLVKSLKIIIYTQQFNLIEPNNISGTVLNLDFEVKMGIVKVKLGS